MDIVGGKNSAQAYWQGALDMGIKSFKGELIDMDASENFGYLVGEYKFFDSDDQELTRGSGYLF
jgi:ketosteroid isomerase-like protein